MDTYLTYFDMFRYISGTLLVLLMLCHGILPERSHYRLRAGLCCGAALAAALCYVPLSIMMSRLGMSLLFASVIYWIIMSLVPVIMIRVCWKSEWAGTLFRTILCVAAENFMTAVSYYLLAKGLLPDLFRDYPIIASAGTVCLYVFLLLIGRSQLRPRVSIDENSLYQNQKNMAAGYLWAYVSIYILFSATKLCLEMILPELEAAAETVETAGTLSFLRYYLTLTLVLLSVAISFILISAYQNLTLQSEKQIITQMLRERQSQYEFSRENSEMIKQLAHDFKHQLRALEKIPDQEYRRRREEAERTIGFYDAVVHTGNEALDTILTEKSIYCSNHDIRLSCTVSSILLDRIGVVDLYTLLGNAIDNSIEAVGQLSEPEKKTISLTIRDQDQMLYMQLENYYEGDLQLEDGLPLTTKQDEQLHGYGTKSIRAIVRNYGGTVLIRTEDRIFSLEILIPM